MMIPPNSFGIDAFLLLIQQWFDVIIATSNAKKLADFSVTWMMLGEVLCGSLRQSCFSKFHVEMSKLAQEGREGYPPVGVIEQRLRELLDVGLHEGFLVVAVRDATEDIIARNHPWALNQWVQLANQLVPRKMRLSHRGNDIAPAQARYSPDE
jgi:hypothetical protein